MTVPWRRISVALIVGAVGFGLNLIPLPILEVNGAFGGVFFGFVAPMIITLAWGWRYGLPAALPAIAAAAALSWSGSFLAGIYSLAVAGGWFVWHGAFAVRRRGGPPTLVHEYVRG